MSVFDWVCRYVPMVVLACFSFGGCTEEAPDLKPRFPWEDWLDWERLVDWDTLMVDGLARTYNVHLPAGYDTAEGPFPVVIGLHGTGGSAVQFDRHYHLSEKADQAGFIAVYPNGVRSDGRLGIRTWNAGSCCDFAVRENVNDVGFISRLIDELIATYRADPSRIYVTGMSNGGMLAYRLAAEVPEKIAAIAPVSCSMVIDPPPVQTVPMPIIHLHSALDRIVPYEGGANALGYQFPPVDSVLQVWAARNGCRSEAQLVTDNGRYRQVQWVTDDGTPLIIHYLTADGGHAWPGGERTRPNADPPSTAIQANDIIWAFFKERARD